MAGTFLFLTMITKADVVQHIHNLLKTRQSFLESELKSLRNVVAGETKSSMGDKYETSRAQAHLEIEKLAKRFQDTSNLLTMLRKAELPTSNNSVGFGNLVKTSNGVYFIGFGLGKINVGDSVVFAVSAASPIAKLMLNKKPSEAITINGNPLVIEQIDG